ncbi:MAG: chromosomal replication initiator protein DnaA [Leptospiraceae bacterium]|nr:chromosomal replication initiator protein DnaA [Leptospiraceae bacterium]MDW8306196.1 chromosomal replication initiator protein DnaA [Leptospiraceae bacterium]
MSETAKNLQDSHGANKKTETLPDAVLWHMVYEKLQEHVPQQFFFAFFEHLKVENYDGKTLRLSGQNPQIVEHIKKRYLKLLTDLASQAAEQPVEVELTSSGKPQRPPSLVNQERNYPQTIHLNPNYTFERFIKGPSNEHAYSAAKGVAERPGEFHNPLYIYGGVGLGKTHLMMAIGNEINKTKPWLKVQYTPAESFQSDLVEAVRNGLHAHFKARYRNVDVFLFDDIQFIGQRAEYTQEEIYHTFNYLFQNKKQIVISSDRPPQQLSKLHDRLQSRFHSGLVIDIKPPNLETRLAILQARSEEMKLKISFDVLRYLASRFTGQVRTLEAALVKLQFYSEHEKRPIDLQMAKLALRDLPQEDSGPQVTIDEILRVVARTFQVNEEDIKGASRVENVALARHVCMYLARQILPSLSLAQIAQAFGRSDHTTVLHAEKKVKELADRDDAFRVQLQELRAELQF